MALLTTLAITRLAVRLFKNSNAFIRNIDTQYDSQFAVEGAKIGDTLKIRLPNDYTVAEGPALSAQETNEQYTTLVVNRQAQVATTFSAARVEVRKSSRIHSMSVSDCSASGTPGRIPAWTNR